MLELAPPMDITSSWDGPSIMPSLSDQNSRWVLPWSCAWIALAAQEDRHYGLKSCCERGRRYSQISSEATHLRPSLRASLLSQHWGFTGVLLFSSCPILPLTTGQLQFIFQFSEFPGYFFREAFNDQFDYLNQYIHIKLGLHDTHFLSLFITTVTSVTK